MVSTFDLCGLCELTHARRPKLTGFFPLDPEAQLFARGEIDFDEFGDIMFGRIESSKRIADRQNKRLLIREHTHGYFFNPHTQDAVPTGPSWAADQFEKRLGESLPIIVSVRDPVDSWLGFRRNFVPEKPTVFADYCRIYNLFLDRLDAWQTQGNLVFQFRYEDLVADTESLMSDLGQFLGEEFSGLDLEKASTTASSGNSGRQDATPVKRSRRPYTSRLLEQASVCPEYTRLCERLGYSKIDEGLTRTDRYRARFYDVVAQFGKLGGYLETPGRWVYDQIKGGKNIQ